MSPPAVAALRGLLAGLVLTLALIVGTLGALAPGTWAASVDRPGSVDGGGPLRLAVLRDAVAVAERVARREDARVRAAARAHARTVELRALRRTRAVRGALRRAWLSGAIDRAQYVAWRTSWWRATRAAGRLRGLRAREQRAALRIVAGLAARRELTATRLPLALLTVQRNTEQWTHRPLPVAGQRMTFGADPVVFRYEPGQGIHVHWLSTAGVVNGRARDCLSPGHGCSRRVVRRGLARLVALSSRRDGFSTWESLYRWGQGRGPWISAMTQATALQALARGARVLHDRRYARFARRGLGAFEARPPLGVATRTARGRRYAMYSFAPSLQVLNGQLQTLVGLRDFATLSGSRRAHRLYAAGARELRPALHRYDTGAWSLYAAGGREASLGYHQLTQGFLHNLCRRTRAAAWCRASARMLAYEREPPRLGLARFVRLRPRRARRVVFALSKVSLVTVAVVGPGGTRTLERATLPRGVHRVRWTPARSGRYRVVLDAIGPGGTHGRLARAVDVRAPRRHARPRPPVAR